MELYYRLILYIIFGTLPSLIWLFYYLNKDQHQEPRRMIIKIFLYGACITLPVFLIQLKLLNMLFQLQEKGFFNSYPWLAGFIEWFFVIAASEEIFKYLIVRLAVLESPELDEPIDLMIYMIVAALGFAALENILYLFEPQRAVSFAYILETAVSISIIRFLGATFLHTLVSALVGYFLVMSFFNLKKRFLLTSLGLVSAIILHGLYNISIISLDSPFNIITPLFLVLGLIIFISGAFVKVKSLKSICKL